MKKLLILFVLLLMPFTASAATYFFNPPLANLSSNSQFNVEVMLDAEGEFINAVEGEIKFPRKALDVVEIDTAKSIVSGWTLEPTVNGDSINFAGVIPGGFDGVRKPLDKDKYPGLLFTITFKGKKPGENSIVISKILSLRNDGIGSEVLSATIPFAFRIDDTNTATEHKNLLILAIIVVVFIGVLLRQFL